MKRKTGFILITILFLSSGVSGFFYFTTPVKALVFNTNLPNVELGVLLPRFVGEYDIHLTDLNLSGFFKVGNETVNYFLHIGSADILYSVEMTEDFNLSVLYRLDYRDLNFSVSSPSFSIMVDYSEFSSHGELQIILLDENTMNIQVWETVPRYALAASTWAPLEIGVIREIGSL